MEAEVSIGATSDGKVWAGLHITELISAVTGRWGTLGTHTGACRVRSLLTAALSCPGISTTQTALEPGLRAGGWEPKASQKLSLWCRQWGGLPDTQVQPACHHRQDYGSPQDKGSSESTSFLCEASIWTRLRTSLNLELFRSEVLLWGPLSVDFNLHLDCLGQYYVF